MIKAMAIGVFFGFLISAVGLMAVVTYSIGSRMIHHRLTYGYWFEHYRVITREDIECAPPSTITIKAGEYLDFPQEEIIAWCGFEGAYSQMTFTGSAAPR